MFINTESVLLVLKSYTAQGRPLLIQEEKPKSVSLKGTSGSFISVLESPYFSAHIFKNIYYCVMGRAKMGPSVYLFSFQGLSHCENPSRIYVASRKAWGGVVESDTGPKFGSANCRWQVFLNLGKFLNIPASQSLHL